MSEQHATPARTVSQDSVPLPGPVVPAGVIPLDIATWKARSKAKAYRAELMKERASEIETELLATVGELAAKITALGLPGDPHPDRIADCGTVYKAPGRAKQAEARRRGERMRFLEELKNLPIDEPLPIALTAKAQEILSRRAKGATV